MAYCCFDGTERVSVLRCGPAGLLHRLPLSVDVIIRLQICREVLRQFKSCDLLDATSTFKQYIGSSCVLGIKDLKFVIPGFYSKTYFLKIKF